MSKNNSFKLLSQPKTAQVLGLSINTLKKFRENGKGPKFMKIEGTFRYPIKKIEEWIDESSSSTEEELLTKEGKVIG